MILMTLLLGMATLLALEKLGLTSTRTRASTIECVDFFWNCYMGTIEVCVMFAIVALNGAMIACSISMASVVFESVLSILVSPEFVTTYIPVHASATEFADIVIFGAMCVVEYVAVAVAILVVNIFWPVSPWTVYVAVVDKLDSTCFFDSVNCG